MIAEYVSPRSVAGTNIFRVFSYCNIENIVLRCVKKEVQIIQTYDKHVSSFRKYQQFESFIMKLTGNQAPLIKPLVNLIKYLYFIIYLRGTNMHSKNN